MIRPLVDREFAEWSEEEIQRLAVGNRSVRFVDMSSATQEARAVYMNVEPELSQLV